MFLHSIPSSLLDFTSGRRLTLDQLDLDGENLAITVVIVGGNTIHFTPPCESTHDLSFLFLNGQEVSRFLLLDDQSGLWLDDRGQVRSEQEMVDLPLKMAIECIGGREREEFLRRLDS